MASDPPVLGIDFGTTNTAAAWCDEASKIHLVPVAAKRYTLPSIVWYGGGDRILVGEMARKQIADDPTHTIIGAKRFLGRRYNSEFVTKNKDRYVYPIIEDDVGNAAVDIFGAPISFIDAAFEIIHRIVELANGAAGLEFEKVVLTVPAHFSYGQRKAVRTAAEMSGLDVRAVVNEPTAAALYYAKHREASDEVLVFDLGGGTFDATLLQVDRREVRVLATGGDAFLGGHDFDSTIVDHLVNSFQDRHGIDLRENKVVLQRLRSAAETAKILLSKEDTAKIRVPFVAQNPSGGFLDLETVITRDELEDLTEGLIERCLGIVEDVLKRGNREPSQVGEVVFVGGQTRMPRIRDRLTDRFDTDPGKNVHPELGVAVGAAILGRTLGLPNGAALIDVIPIPIGIMAAGIGSVEVLSQNSTIPCTERTAVTRPPAGQPLMIAIYEAVDATSVDRDLLGTVRVPPEWLEENEGDLLLEMRMGHDFDLTLSILASEGGSARLELKPPPRNR
ncbi:MAG: Hsp70 family protein [Deltaproteobacteria bacterium]|nr:Hsp70 family protein [Deltaproteobacteria bacterium]